MTEPWTIAELKILFGIRDRMAAQSPSFDHEIREAFRSEIFQLVAKPRVARILEAEAAGVDWDQHWRILVGDAWFHVKKYVAEPIPSVECMHGDYPQKIREPEETE